ncbi:MAG: twin-arginine translocase subunit TatC [Acidobacteria bacterium]|nr:twin-arginine translocase subunit TatC [Acidobacteriota bacterium]
MALVPFLNKAPATAAGDDLDPDREDGQDDTDAAGRMSFLDHLDELRRRIVYAVIAIGVGFLIAFLFIDEIFNFIMLPLQRMLPAGGTLIYTDPTEAFVLYIKIALIAGLLLASPAVMLQVWLFVAPGLYSNEKKWAIPFVVMSSFFFVLGAAFSHYVVFPLTWKFFVSFTTDILTFMPRIEPVFSIYLRLLLAFGVVFQMPTLVLFLARMGMVSARFLVKNFKYAVLIMVVIAAVVTPDGGGVSLVAMAGPMILLYGLSIILAWLFGKKKTADDA